MTFAVARSDGATAVLTIAGELDISNIDQLAAAVEPVIEARRVVNAGGLRFADSSAIALWVRWAADVEVELRDPPAILRQVITRMGLAGKLALK
ncbi:MAG: STAS domain-containing protein [Solirubrobacterales bacterium]|nr:STAS domain-containing protein [Solirubrobacterales bacterium]